MSDKGEVTVAFGNIAKSPSQEDFRNALAIRDLQERPVESKGKLKASVTIHNAHETHSCAQTETSVRKGTQKIIPSEFEESISQRQISISERDPNRWEKTEDLQMHHRMTRGLQSGMMSKKSLQDTTQTPQRALRD